MTGTGGVAPDASRFIPSLAQDGTMKVMADNTQMQAPKGTTSAVIEGHEYDVPKNGVITVKNEAHIETLKRHGFTEVDNVEDVHSQIDEQDDKAELVRIIEEHGGEADDTMSLKKLRRLAHEQVGGEE